MSQIQFDSRSLYFELINSFSGNIPIFFQLYSDVVVALTFVIKNDAANMDYKNESR